MAKARQQASPRPERPRKAGKVEARTRLSPRQPTCQARREARPRQARPRPQGRPRGAAAGDPEGGAARSSPRTASRPPGSTTWPQRAGVAKGTLYLYFRDKEALFEALVRNAVSPLLEQMRRIAAAPDIPPLQALETFFAVFEKEVLGTERKLLLRLIMAEGPRFPAIAEFYYREVVSPGPRHDARAGETCGDARARSPPTRPRAIPSSSSRRCWWRSSGTGCSPRSIPSTSARLLRAHREVLTGRARKGRHESPP